MTRMQCYNGELPPLEGLSDCFDGIFISGSHYSAYEGKRRCRRLYSKTAQCAADATVVVSYLQSDPGFKIWKAGCGRQWHSILGYGC